MASMLAPGLPPLKAPSLEKFARMKLAPLCTAVVSGTAADTMMAGRASAMARATRRSFFTGTSGGLPQRRQERGHAGGIGTGFREIDDAGTGCGHKKPAFVPAG